MYKRLSRVTTFQLFEWEKYLSTFPGVSIAQQTLVITGASEQKKKKTNVAIKSNLLKAVICSRCIDVYPVKKLSSDTRVRRFLCDDGLLAIKYVGMHTSLDSGIKML